ncbi:MAG: hypothetical protein KDA37_15910, partial [Planctomycetales bacterium]|nr:hypothetical protein [Planctomycetales bacterium]
MSNSETQIVESFTYDGALSWLQGAGLFLLLAVLVGWLLWRERGVTGRKTAGLFYVLRLASLALVIWMLLGPAHQSVERTTIPQTLAIIADVSQSMNVSEPMPRLEALRWRQAIDPEEDPHPELSAMDAALVVFRYAFDQVNTARTAGDEYAPAEEVAGAFEVAGKAAHLTLDRLRQAKESLAEQDRDLSRQVESLAQEIRADWLPQLEDLTGEWRQAKEADLIERRTAADALEEDADRLLRRVETVNRDVCASVLQSEPDRSDSTVASLSRRELSNRMLAQLEKSVLEELSKTTNIKRVRVDTNASPVPDKLSWDDATQASAAPAG